MSNSPLPPDFDTFGALLRYLRRRAQLTQRDLGLAVGYSETHVTRLENGQRRPDLLAVKSVFLEALGLTQEPALAQRLFELAAVARSEPTIQANSDLAAQTLSKSRLTNLLTPLTRLVGREQEINEVQHLLRESRLVTLTGAGGVGKTRLAHAVATRLLGTFVDGVWWVELAAQTDPALVPQMAAATFKLIEPPGHTLLDTLTVFLQTKFTLFILDNCEHLVMACADLAMHLLQHCPQLHILVTSRQTLRVPGEVVYRVPSLTIPPLADSTRDLNHYESVQLFTERARASQHSFVLTTGNAAAVAHLCRKLDGIPLAIELATAQVKVLSVEQITTRLDYGFQAFSDGARAVLPRHRTLRATLDWSYDLLSDPQRVLFRKLSVFAGSFSLEAAEAIGSSSFETSPTVSAPLEVDTLALLSQLTDQSLVVTIFLNDRVRYRLLEPIRQYARQKLSEAGAEEPTRQRHLDFFTRIAEEAKPYLQRAGPNRNRWCDYIEADLDNFRAALDLIAQNHDVAMGERMINGLWYFWQWKVYPAEGIRWINTILIASSSPGNRAYVMGRIASAYLSTRTGDFVQALAWQEEALPQAQALGDKELILKAMEGLGFATPNYEQAIQLETEAIQLANELGCDEEKAGILFSLGRRMHIHGDDESATRLLLEGVRVARACQDNIAVAWCFCELGLIALTRAEDGMARSMFEDSVTSAREAGDPVALANCQLELARLALRQRREAEGVGLIHGCIVVFQQVGNTDRVADCLAVVAGVAQTRGEIERAVQLLSVAANVQHDYRRHTVLKRRIYAEYEHRLAVLRAVVPAADFEAAWVKGAQMTPTQAVDEVLAMNNSVNN